MESCELPANISHGGDRIEAYAKSLAEIKQLARRIVVFSKTFVEKYVGKKKALKYIPTTKSLSTPYIIAIAICMAWLGAVSASSTILHLCVCYMLQK